MQPGVTVWPCQPSLPRGPPRPSPGLPAPLGTWARAGFMPSHEGQQLRSKQTLPCPLLSGGVHSPAHSHLLAVSPARVQVEDRKLGPGEVGPMAGGRCEGRERRGLGNRFGAWKALLPGCVPARRRPWGRRVPSQPPVYLPLVPPAGRSQHRLLVAMEKQECA